MTTFRPTKLCPHRWCRPVHAVITLAAAAVVAHDLTSNPLIILMLVPLGLTGWLLQRAVHGKTITDLAVEEAAHTGNGGLPLVVRPVWANIAITADLVYFALFAMTLGTIASGTAGEPQLPPPSLDAFLLGGFGLGFFAFGMYAHRKATEPAKPSRVLAPAPGKA